MTRSATPAWSPAPLALLAWVAGLALSLSLDDPRLRFEAHLGAYALATLGWWGLARSAPSGRALALAVGAAVVLRVWALALPPAFSEDVFRYVYEGRLVWHLGPGAPFAHPPAAGPGLGLPPGLLDEAWLRINHPEISTIYPPLAQLTFALAGGLGELFRGGHLLLLKGLLVAADLGTWAVLALILRARGRPPSESLWYGASPLVILEVAREGHADSLSALGLALGLLGFLSIQVRPRLGYAGFALAALAKLNGLVVLPAALRVTRRGLWVALALCTLLALPWLLAGPGAGHGLSEYATRWRAGDGAFGGLLAAAELLLGGDWARVAGFTVTRHQLARALVAVVFAVGALAILRPPGRPVAARAGALLLLLLLLSPTLHPWYVLWILPFAVAGEGFTGRGAALLLATLSVLLHHPGWLELQSGEWVDLGWVRGVVHVPVWALWIRASVRRHRALG